MNERCSHAVLDQASRRLKGAKIERLLGLQRASRPLRILEVGCGSGGIAQYLATRPAGHEVHAVDTVDSRIVSDGYAFQTVDGTALPFGDASFDVVVSNHVLEHVGRVSAQRDHLREARRVLKPTGVAYLAIPNRWRVIEPHYRLPALSIWPRAVRTPYLRLFRRGQVYDCEPLAIWTVEHLVRAAGFRPVRLGVPALRATLELEHPTSWAARLARRLPLAALRRLEPILPTLIFRLEPITDRRGSAAPESSSAGS